MFSAMTIEKFIKAMKKWILYFTLIVNDIHVSISTGNDKIGNVLNVSTAAIFTCPHCDECKWYCYDIRDCFRHGYDSSTMKARAMNTAIMRADRNRFFKEIDDAINKNAAFKYFRFHVGGEIPDYDYFCRMIAIVKNHPDVLFWTYTKMYSIVNRWIDENGSLPANFHVMFSEWRGLPMDNPHNLPEFRVVFKDEKPEPDVWICPGNCDICKKLNRGCIANETTQAIEH